MVNALEFSGHRILIGIGGGIGAYKICEVVSTLAKAGAEVKVLLTNGACQFITPLTLSTLSRHPAYTDQDFWQPIHHRPLHIELGEWAEVFLLAPLTANTLAKLAHGLADNLLANTVLASTCPVLLGPAMNTDMWQQKSVQRNWQLLLSDPRYHQIGPGDGILACDRIGTGRMAEPPDMLTHLFSLLQTSGQRNLAGKRILISAGGTREHWDPVRFIGNPSTGKMGLALAQAALHRGALVTLVHGPMDRVMQPPGFIQTIPVTSAHEMHQAMLAQFPQADWTILSAAVADFKPTEYHATKIPKQDLATSMPLAPVPDIAAELGQRKRPQQKLVGFAAQTGDIVTPALKKLEKKNLDAIAANPIDQSNSGFGSNQNQAILIDRARRQQTVQSCSKLQMAHQLLDFVQQLENSQA